MLSALVIALREGLEAALIIAILAAYLVRAHRRAELRGLLLGAGAAGALCAAVGLTVALGAAELPTVTQEIIEGISSVLAVVLLTWMIFFMRKHARSQKSELEASAARALASTSRWALPLVAFSAVAREGLETVLFLYASFRNSTSTTGSGVGAVVGLLVAAALGFGIYRGGVHLNLRRFFQVTGGLLVIVAGGLLAGAVHAMNEAGAITVLTRPAWDLNGILSDTGFVGSVLHGLMGYVGAPNVLQVIAWWGYIVPTLIAFYGLPRFMRQAGTAAAPQEKSASVG